MKSAWFRLSLKAKKLKASANKKSHNQKSRNQIRSGGLTKDKGSKQDFQQ